MLIDLYSAVVKRNFGIPVIFWYSSSRIISFEFLDHIQWYIDIGFATAFVKYVAEPTINIFNISSNENDIVDLQGD